MLLGLPSPEQVRDVLSEGGVRSWRYRYYGRVKTHRNLDGNGSLDLVR